MSGQTLTGRLLTDYLLLASRNLPLGNIILDLIGEIKIAIVRSLLCVDEADGKRSRRRCKKCCCLFEFRATSWAMHQTRQKIYLISHFFLSLTLSNHLADS
jgi:hypothetical protein